MARSPSRTRVPGAPRCRCGDAPQGGFIRAGGALGRSRRGRPFPPGPRAIVVNGARNRRRRAGRQAALALRAFDPGGDDTETAAVRNAERERVLAVVSGMREDDRLAIACRYFLDLSEDETAQALGWPRGTVKSRLSPALARLRETMG